MRSMAVGVHRKREDVEPIAEAVPIGELFLSAVAIADDQPIGDRDLLIRIAGVRQKLLERATFVAVRYGFAFANAADANAKCLPHIANWKRVLDENRERVELTLKVAASGSPRPQRKDFKSGADYLRALHHVTRAAHVDDAFRREVEARLVPLCVKWKWTARDTSSMEFAGLIERSRIDEISRAGEAIKAACPAVPFLLSAPWPLEVFTDVDHE